MQKIRSFFLLCFYYFVFSNKSVISQYMNTVKPMHEEFVEPSKKNADIIVLEGGMNLVAMDMIKNHIRQHLSAQTQV